jgi:hypothetical protein
MRSVFCFICLFFLSFRNNWTEGIELATVGTLFRLLWQVFVRRHSIGATAPIGPEPSHRGHTITLGWTPLDEWSARRRYLYLTTPNTTDSHAPCGIRTTILSGERPETYALDSAVTGIDVRSHKRHTVTWWQGRFISLIIPDTKGDVSGTERCISIVMRWVPAPASWHFEVGG